jgi:hypothetical protein
MTAILVIFFLAGRNFFDNKNSLRLLSFSSFIILTHLIRGYTLSGSPFFPNTLFIAEFLPWSVPKDIAFKDVFDIYAIARNPTLPPHITMGNWDWLSTWIQNRFSLVNKIYSILAILLICINSYLLFIKSKMLKKNNELFFIFIPILTSLIFWFSTAPDFRYLGSALEILISLLFFVLFSFFLKGHNLSIKYRYINPIYICFVAIFMVIIPNINFKLFGPWADLPQTKLIQEATPLGVKYNKPINGLCWYSAVPCVESLDNNLRYLDGGNIESGISVK